jgi:phospholipase/carboxylesterase
MTKQAVILLHGVGSNGDDLKPLGDFWAQALPSTLFISPNAPFRFDQGPGYQWFSLNGITAETRPQRIVRARESLDHMLNTLCEQHQLDPEVDNIVLVGFSQGSIMALDLLVTCRIRLAGVVAFSGRLSSPEPKQPGNNRPVLLIHGQRDPVIPWSESESAASQLVALGYNVTTQYEPNTVHTISNEGVLKAAQFLRERFMADNQP